MAHLSTNPADKNRWICIYPAYINSKKTVAEGRKIPKEKALENPTLAELRDVCQAVGLPVATEGTKMYPRDQNRDPTFRGRVRVQLKNADGTFVSDQFKTRKDVMFQLTEMIPKLKSRTQKQGGSEQQPQSSTGKKGKKKGKR
ncbi:signal recognition particle 19 kDa protein-like [Lytechinus variegatus]|uniref:signal recognition particle 19 kDa protein-like n=1 Tax=Lytechinus variegatus TaxID=7654 RepID=UPI001BB23F16|nr:signal recognition particle 19 kDa protein-like [Lytechinus variegatus]